MILLLIFLSVIQHCSSLKVLVYSPAFAASHTNFMAHLADTLIEAGHTVTFLVPVTDEARKNQLGVKITKDVYIVDHDEEMKKSAVPLDNTIVTYWRDGPHTRSFGDAFIAFTDSMKKSCANFLRHPAVLEDMRSRNFDVAIVEPMSVCGVGFIKKLGIEKVIHAISCVHYDFLFPYIGEPEMASYVPSLSSYAGDKMSFTQRVTNKQEADSFGTIFTSMFDYETQLYRETLGEDLPDWKELLPTASFFLTNSNPFIDFPRPILPKTIPIGGISVDMDKIRSQKVSEEWDEVLNRRQRTMLISFGSMVKSYQMPIEWRKNILEVIKSMPDVTFIWKFETNETDWASGVENVYFSKWVPQTALLSDARLTAFLTHGGIGSTHELAFCGKPALMVPIFGDQVRNSNMLARHNGVIVVDKFDLANKEVISGAVQKILYDQSYQENAHRLAKLLENQPSKPKEQVVKHTEFVAEFGPLPQMDPYVRHLNFFQQHFLDLYILTGLIYLTIFSIFAFLIRYLYLKVTIKVVGKKTKIN